MWDIDPAHSEISFKVKHLVFSSVRGYFKEFNAQIETSGDDFTTLSMDVWINPASIDTRNEQRNTHLKSADFFDVEHFNEIRFSANEFIAAGEKSHYELHGDLTMKGISKHIILQVEFSGLIKDPWGAEKALFTIAGKINRKDWGLNYNTVLETGGVLVGEEVLINCEVQLIKQM